MARTIQVNAENLGDNYEPIPAGTRLKVVVYDVKEGVSGPNAKYPNSPRFEWTAKVTEDGKYKGREIKFNYVPLDPSVPHAWNLAAFAEAVGWEISKDDQGNGSIAVPDNLNDVLGTEVLAKIGTRTPDEQGRVFNQIDKVFKLPAGGGGTPQPAQSAEIDWSKLN